MFKQRRKRRTYKEIKVSDKREREIEMGNSETKTLQFKIDR